MHHKVSLSIAKITVLISLLFISNPAYAQEHQNGWKHGFGVHSVRYDSERQGLLQQSTSSALVIEYAPRRDWGKWSLILGIGTGISDDSFTITNVASNATIRPNLEVDYQASVAGLYRISNKFSLGPALLYNRATATFLGTTETQTDDEVGLALSFHSQNRKHAFEMYYGKDSTISLGYRWSR